MTIRWRRLFHKACDCVFVMPAGYGDAWPAEMFEPCLIGICFPYLPHRPWQLKGAPRLLALERQVQSLWEDGETPLSLLTCANFSVGRGSFQPCQKMWCGRCYTSDPEVSFYIKQAVDDEGIVWKRKKETERFTAARKGDHVSCPFQCDLCIFRLR